MRQLRNLYLPNLLVLAFGIAIPSIASAQQAESGAFQIIAFPDAVTTGGPGTRVGINPQGQIVGRYKLPDGTFHGFMLTDGAFTTITFPGSNRTEAYMALMRAARSSGCTLTAAARFAGFY